MKKIILVLCIAAISSAAFAQTKSCCTAPEIFATFSNDLAFVSIHDEPLPFQYTETIGEMITFEASDGKMANAYSVKATKNTNKYLLVFHEWWGLNDYIKQTADQLYADLGGEVNVIALDLFDGKVTAEREKAKEYSGTLEQERAKAIIKGIENKMGNNAEVTTIGWCMGGAWSMQAAIILQKKAVGCVVYYGMPEADVERIKTLDAPVLFVHAIQDKHITNDVVNTFEKNMQEAGKKVKVLRYDADHAFANPSNPKHHKEYTADAYTNSLKFLKESFGK